MNTKFKNLGKSILIGILLCFSFEKSFTQEAMVVLKLDAFTMQQPFNMVGADGILIGIIAEYNETSNEGILIDKISNIRYTFIRENSQIGITLFPGDIVLYKQAKSYNSSKSNTSDGAKECKGTTKLNADGTVKCFCC